MGPNDGLKLGIKVGMRLGINIVGTALGIAVGFTLGTPGHAGSPVLVTLVKHDGLQVNKLEPKFSTDQLLPLQKEAGIDPNHYIVHV